MPSDDLTRRIRRDHRNGRSLAAICQRHGVTHTIVYRAIRGDANRHPRIIHWTPAEDRVLIDGQDMTKQELSRLLPGRTPGAIGYRRNILRKRGVLPPAQ